MRNLFPIVLLLVTACGSSDSDGDGDDDGQRFGPSDACLAAIACASAVDPDNAMLYESAYGQGAACWADAAEALDCARECEAEMEIQAVADPTNRACWLGDTPEARWLFAAVPVWQFANNDDGCFDATGTFSASDEGPDFSFSIVFQNGFTRNMQCSLEADLTFVCERYTLDGSEYEYSGSFAEDLSEATLRNLVDGAPYCSFNGLPGVS